MIRGHDVLVAGAGPAGAHTALRLARAGWRVALIDARYFPRTKPCGEFLSPACLPMLDELGLLEPLEGQGAVHVEGMHLHAGGELARGRYVAIGRHAPPTPTVGYGLGIRRELLDSMAVSAAQAHDSVSVLLGWRVHTPLRDREGRVCGLAVSDPQGVRSELRAHFVVGADGANSRVAHGMGWATRSSGRERFAIVARFEGVEPRSEAEVHVLPGGDYFAACPIDGGLFTANLVVDGSALGKGRASLGELFRSRLEFAPRLRQRLVGARVVDGFGACGPLRRLSRRVVAPGVALVGDACRFVDPLTGEGLFFAMRGAQLLSHALDLALRDPRREASALRGYERSRRREFAARYGLAEMLQRGLRNPALPARLIALLGRRPSLCDLVLGLTGDYVPPSALLAPALWLRVLARSQRKPPRQGPGHFDLLAAGPRGE